MRQALRFVEAAIESLREYDSSSEWVKHEIYKLEELQKTLMRRIAQSASRAFR